MPPGLPVPRPVPHWGEKVPVSNHTLLLLGLGRGAVGTWARSLPGSGGGSWTCLAPSCGHLTPAQNPLPHQPRSGNSRELLEPVVTALKVAQGLSPGPANKHTLFSFSLLSHGAVAVEASIRRSERLERSLPVLSAGCRKPRPGRVWHAGCPPQRPPRQLPARRLPFGRSGTRRAQGVPSALRGRAAAASPDLNPNVVCASVSTSVQRRGS